MDIISEVAKLNKAYDRASDANDFQEMERIAREILQLEHDAYSGMSNKKHEERINEDYRDEYIKRVNEADEKYPDLEDKWCPNCGSFLVKGSINYGEGFHIDGCE